MFQLPRCISSVHSPRDQWRTILLAPVNTDHLFHFHTFALLFPLFFHISPMHRALFAEFLPAIQVTRCPFLFSVSFLTNLLTLLISNSSSSTSGVNARGSSDVESFAFHSNLPFPFFMLFPPPPSPKNNFSPFLPGKIQETKILTKLSGLSVPETRVREKWSQPLRAKPLSLLLAMLRDHGTGSNEEVRVLGSIPSTYSIIISVLQLDLISPLRGIIPSSET